MQGLVAGERRDLVLGPHLFHFCSPFEDVVLVFGEIAGQASEVLKMSGQGMATLMFAIRNDVVFTDGIGQEWRVAANNVGIMYRPADSFFEIATHGRPGFAALSLHIGLETMDKEPFKRAFAGLRGGLAEAINCDGALLGTLRMTTEIRALVLELIGSFQGDQLRPLDPSIRTLQLLAGLNIATEQPQNEVRWLMPTGGALERMFRARDILESRLAEPLNLSLVASLVSLSEARLKSGFRATFGMPPMAYLATLRVDRAKHLLRRTDVPIGQIAWAVGYPHQCNFAVAFKRATGVTPRQFRQGREAELSRSAHA